MKDQVYKFGVYFDYWGWRHQQFGIGLVWTGEKYFHINLFCLEIAIGVTAR